jgi:hypothetical protein
VLIFRGEDEGVPAWHCVLVPIGKVADSKAQKPGTAIDVTNFGRFIKYHDNQGNIREMSGWGTGPSKMLRRWAKKHYGKKKSMFAIYFNGKLC